MQIALDPYMLRRAPLPEVVRITATLGYDALELSPRQDFLPFFVAPRANADSIGELRQALRDHGVALASLLPLYRWSSPDETERRAAVRYWKRAIEIAVALGCHTMNSEFSGRLEKAEASEAAFWSSMEELLPIFEREGITLNPARLPHGLSSTRLRRLLPQRDGWSGAALVRYLRPRSRAPARLTAAQRSMA
ncbi:MAG: sugar phosphate isomerase/epimerase [Chloroflexi bacterium]|nr:sugar phosphate isomerase/epimerase [Chloroflexota bacterium]